jgi:AAA+ ATPase superfamily predicted ATPase
MHVSPTFEKICRQALEAWRSPQSIGRWWDSEDEVDIVAVAEKTLLTCECKWTGSPMGRRELAELQRRTGKVLRALGGDFETEHYLFSKSSFKGLEEGNGLHLIDPERLEQED